MLDEHGKGPHILVSSAGNVEAGGIEIEFVFGHGLSGPHHELFIATDLAVHDRGNSRSGLLRLLGLRSTAWRASGRSTTTGLRKSANRTAQNN